MIRLTRQTDYGIVLLTSMATAAERRCTAAELAERTLLPLPMVSKILKTLAREGLLDSQRGVKGGYSLARDAEEITLADIVGALEGPIAITDCVEGGGTECSYESSCHVRPHWQVINDALLEALGRVRLSDLCQFPSERPIAVLDPLVSLGSLR